MNSDSIKFPGSHLALIFQRLSRAASIAVMIIAGTVLFGGWAFGSPALQSLVPGLPRMMPNTAIGLLLAGASLFLVSSAPPRKGWIAWIAGFLAAAVAGLGMATIAEYLLGTSLHIDELLFKDYNQSATFPGRPSPQTSLGFAFSGLSLVFMGGRRLWMLWTSQALSLVAGFIALLAFIGYVYKSLPFYGVTTYTGMALHTIFGFLLLSFGILFARPDRGLTAIFTSNSGGGMLARRLLPAAIIIPLVLGGLRAWSEMEGLFSTGFGHALEAALYIIALAVPVWFVARVLDRIESGRAVIEGAVRQREAVLPSGHVVGYKSDVKSSVSFSFKLLLIFILLILIVLIGAYLFYGAQKQAIYRRVESELAAIAQLKIDQIAAWRQDRLADASILVNNLNAGEIAEWLNAPDPQKTGKVRARLEIMGKHYPYEEIALVSPDGRVLMNINNTQPLEVSLSHLAAAFRERKPVFIDFYDLPGSDQPRLDVIAPFFLPENDKEKALALVLSIDSEHYLYPLIQSWPMPNRTAETLLVRREDDYVLFLNELRHQKNTALKLKIPLSRQEVPAVISVSGKEGIFEGRDYRGVKALSFLKPVPASPWFMVAKIDSEEALADVRKSALLTMGLLSGSVVMISVLGGLQWQRRQKIAYQTLYRAEAERIAIEDSLRQREAELSGIWNSIPIMIFTMDRERRIVKANPAAEKFSGRCQSEMIGMREGEAIGCLHSLDDPRGCGFGPSCQRCRMRLSLLDTFETGINHSDLEWHLPFKCDGSPAEVHFLFSTTLLQTEPKQVMVSVQDITERRKAEEKYRSLYDSSRDGIVYTDMSGKLLSCNNAYSDMLGYSEEELRSLTYQQLTPLKWADMEKEIVLNQIMTRGYSDSYEKEYIRKDGTVFPINIRAWLVRDAEGKGMGMWGIVRDITEHKKAEEAIKALNQDLRIRAVELEASNKELESFSYSVSHDLRAPLRGMAGFSQALLEDYRDKFDERGKRYLKRIQESSELMSRLIDDMLMLSRVTRAEIHRTHIDLTELAKSVLENLKKAEPGRQVEFNVAPGIICQGDSRLMRYVLENLLGNAWKFTGTVALPRIEVGVIARNGTPVFFVRDNGVGFDMAYIDKLFKPFQRLHRSDEFPGTGIGLATVQRIIHRHGGRVWAESEIGKGATFYFSLS